MLLINHILSLFHPGILPSPLPSVHFHFWNLEQSSAVKAGIDPTYQAPFQEAVTSPLLTPLGVEQNFNFLVVGVGIGKRIPITENREGKAMNILYHEPCVGSEKVVS